MAVGSMSRIYCVALIVLLASSLMPVDTQQITKDAAAVSILTELKAAGSAKQLVDEEAVKILLKEFEGILNTLNGADVPKAVVALGSDGVLGSVNLANKNTKFAKGTSTDEVGVVEVKSGTLTWFPGKKGEGVANGIELNTDAVVAKAFLSQYDTKFTAKEMIACHVDFASLQAGAFTKQTYEEGNAIFTFELQKGVVGFDPTSTKTLKIVMTRKLKSETPDNGGGGGGTHAPDDGSDGGTHAPGGGGTSGTSYTGSTTSSASEFGVPCFVAASSIAIIPLIAINMVV